VRLKLPSGLLLLSFVMCSPILIQASTPFGHNSLSQVNDVFAEGLARVRVNGKFGYIDQQGKVVIEEKFDDAHRFWYGFASVCEGTNKFSIDREGRPVPNLLAASGFFSKELSIASVEGGWVFKDRAGRVVTDPPIKGYSVGMSVPGASVARVYLGKKDGLINREGKILPDRFDHIFGFKEGIAKVTDSGKAGFIDNKGNVLVAANLNHAEEYSDGLSLVEKNGQMVYLDKKAKTAFQCEFVSCGPFSDGLAPVRTGSPTNSKVGFIDANGRLVIEPRGEFITAQRFSEDLAVFRSTSGKYGYIDKRGAIVIQPVFIYASEFSEGLAEVVEQGNASHDAGLLRVHGKRGFINKQGRMVIQPQFDEVLVFKEGFVAVREGDEWGYINKNGKFIWRSKN